MVCHTRDSSSTEFDLDLFTCKVRFGCLYIRMGKLLQCHLMGKYCNREKYVSNNGHIHINRPKTWADNSGVICFLKNINIFLVCSYAASLSPLNYFVTVFLIQMYRRPIMTMP